MIIVSFDGYRATIFLRVSLARLDLSLHKQDLSPLAVTSYGPPALVTFDESVTIKVRRVPTFATTVHVMRAAVECRVSLSFQRP